MPAIQLQTFIQRVRQLADLDPEAAFIDEAEIVGHVNRACWALDDILISTWEGYYTKEEKVVLSGTSHVLPADFYKLVGLDVAARGDRWVTLTPYAELRRAELRGGRSCAPEDVRYKVRDGVLSLLPGFSSPTDAFLVYAPQVPGMVAPSDTRTYPNGWEQWAVLQAAIACMTKEERDTSGLEKLWALEDRRVRDAAPVRSLEQVSLDELFPTGRADRR